MNVRGNDNRMLDVFLKPLFRCVVAVVVASALAAVAPAPAAAQTLPTLHIATGGKETDAEVFYAQDLGFFTKAGINADISVMQNGAAIGSAVASGALQVGSSSTLIIANAVSKGLPFVYIAPGGQYNDATPSLALVVPANSPIQSAKDLTGKTIAVLALRGIDQSSAMKWIDDNGGNSAGVKFVEIAAPEMAIALARGTVDAAQLAEPFLGGAAKTVRVLGKSYGAVAKSWMVAGWFSTSDWVAQNPDLVRRFDQAIQMSADWANANPVKAAAILTKYSKANIDRLHTVYGRTLDPAMIAPVIDVGMKYKTLAKPVTPADLIAKPAP
jgi:NitT/TauT family transport system substrate-binding protein